MKEARTHTNSQVTFKAWYYRLEAEEMTEERDFCGFQLHSNIYLILFSDIQGLNNTIIHSYLISLYLTLVSKKNKLSNLDNKEVV